jgi:hypothetical protein
MKQVQWFRLIGLAVIAWMVSLGLAAQSVAPSSLPGNYTKEGTHDSLFLGSSFAAVLHTQGERRPKTGHFIIDGNTLTVIEWATGQSTLFTVQDGKLYDQDGNAWVKPAPAPAPAPTPAPAPEPTPAAAPAPPPAPMPEIAPPPPPADTPPPTISLGQTMDQVTAGFGQPLKRANLGAKVIFYYKDMKVTFTNGKVSNVE